VVDRDGSERTGGAAAEVSDLRSALRGAFAITVGPWSTQLPPTWLEAGSWVAAAEGLAFVRLAPEDGGGRAIRHPHHEATGDGSPADLFIVRRELWRPGGLDIEALRQGPAAAAGTVLGRTIRHVGEFAGRTVEDGSLLPPGADSLLERCGDHWITPRARPGLLRHSILPLDEVLPEAVASDPRPTVLALLPFLAVGGAEKLTLDLIRQLGDRFRFLIVTLAPHDPIFGNRLDDFRREVPHVYTLGDWFLHPLLFSALSHLLHKYEVVTLFNANGTTWFYEALGELRRRFPRLWIVNQLFDHRRGWIEYYSPGVAEACDVHLATNQAIEEVLVHEHAIAPHKVAHIPHGIDLDDFRPAAYPPDRLAELRSKLGVPRDCVLVTMAVRMHPQKRPEDFVALARAMANEKDFFFLLVGGGPLEKTIDDLIDFRGLTNLRRIGFFAPIADLLAATDVACMTSEYEALPLYVLSALAMERPVVATAVGAIDSVLAEGRCGTAVGRVGDLEAFRRALLALRDPALRRQMGRRGRMLVERKFAIGLAAEAYARILLPPPSSAARP
jgi:glycosyltransferase involved in cell wall biosynthesis